MTDYLNIEKVLKDAPSQQCHHHARVANLMTSFGFGIT